jgi:hypothetical protein
VEKYSLLSPKHHFSHRPEYHNLHHPTIGDGGIRVDVAASGTKFLVVLEVCALPHDDAHFKNHFWLNRATKFRAFYPAIVGTENLVVSSLHETIPGAIITVSGDDIVKGLTCRDK